MTGVLALALRRLALSHGTVPSTVPVGQAVASETNGTDGTLGTVGTNGTGGTGTLDVLRAGSDGERRCFVCGQPASFGFGVFLREGREGRWTCAAHRPQGEGRA